MSFSSCKKVEKGSDLKMMCKRKWFALLTVFIVYILLGASFFYKIEKDEEWLKREEAERERLDINRRLNDLLDDSNSSQLREILEEISDYCGKPLLEADDSPFKWDYYHSVFFAITVVTTIGYGNLAPTTAWSRIFMIAYGLIGIPVNGILFATLGEYFGKTFIGVYRKWKNTTVDKMKDYAASLSLISQIILYLIPGLIIFLFLPAIVIQHFEHWDYILSVYYAFVTLTTIGFGDYVAGVTNKGFSELYFVLYQIFLIVWIIFGLGYLVMVIGFLTRGLRSKKMAKLEKHLAHNIKNTHNKIWHGLVKDFTYLRRIMNELYMAKFKPVYRDDYNSTRPPKIGSQSFPDLRKLIQVELSPKPSRRRAFSECLPHQPLARVQSDTDLHRIDKEATFASLEIVQPSELLVNVATALSKGSYGDVSENERGYHGFSDGEILASEIYGSGWTLGGSEMSMQPPRSPRCRAASEVKVPTNVQNATLNEWTWSGPYATAQMQQLRRNKFNDSRTRSKEQSSNKSLFEKIKSTWSKTVDEGLKKQNDIEKQLPQFWDNTVNSNNTVYSQPTMFSSSSMEQERYMNRTKGGRFSVFSVPEHRVLEETSVADLLRALSSIHSKVVGIDNLEPKRKFGTVTPPKVPSVVDLFNNPRSGRIQNTRRASAIPAPSTPRRRFSLHPVNENQLLVPPPPYAAQNSSVPRKNSPSFLSPPSVPPPNLVHKQVQRLRGPAKDRILYTRTRHNSLKDLRIEKPQ